MISKKNFCLLINTIKAQVDSIDEVSDSMPGLAEDLYEITGPLAETLVDAIADDMRIPDIDHIGNTIEWWIWECDYGSKHPDITFKDAKTGRKRTVHITSVEKLYDYLIKYESGVEYEVRGDKQ